MSWWERPSIAAAWRLSCFGTFGHLLASAPLLAEVLEVLRRPKIQALHGLDEQGIRRFIKALYKAAVIIEVPRPMPRVVPDDPKDDVILLTAIAGRADRLATRDRHVFHPEVLRIAAGYGVQIVTD